MITSIKTSNAPACGLKYQAVNADIMETIKGGELPCQMLSILPLRQSMPSIKTCQYFNPITDTNWPVYLCGIRNMEQQELIDCVNAY
jgi:hypothetical protein